MSRSSPSNAVFAYTHVLHALPSLSIHPTLSVRPNEPDITDLGVRLTSVTLRSPPFIDEQHPLPSLMRRSLAHPSQWLKLNSLSIGYECLVITAGTIVAIQVQLLTSGSMAITTTTHALLSFGMILELLGILLAIYFVCFVQCHHSEESRPPPTLVHLASGVPTVLILTGIVVLAAALVTETLKMSLGTAIAMSGFLILGVILCLLASFRGLWKAVMIRDSERG